jgi:hypothetical protein
MSPKVGLDRCGKSRPHRDSIIGPDRSARSQSLYQVSYPGPLFSSFFFYDFNITRQAGSDRGNTQIFPKRHDNDCRSNMTNDR